MPHLACITGMGMLSALGRSLEETAAALAEDRGGIAAITHFDAARFGDAVAGEVSGVVEGDACFAFALEAATQAWRAAGLEPGGEVPVVVGSSAGPHSHEASYDDLLAEDPAEADRVRWRFRHAAIAEVVAEGLGLSGPRLVPATACASGFVALALALDLVRQGWPVVLAGGSEALGWRRLAGFHALGALAPGPCAPFSRPMGLSLGEGAAFYVVESAAHAAARGARPRVWLRGAGLSTDGWHATAPDPRGQGMARALEAALRDGGLRPEDIDGYGAHGTGTEANDAAEWAALGRVFGARVPPIYAPKSLLGHSFGASGPQALALGVLGMEAARWPATLGWTGPREDGPGTPPVVTDGPRAPSQHRHLLALNAAFGGANAAVLISTEAGSAGPSALRPVFLAAAGQAGPEDEVAAMRRLLRQVDPRGLDRPGLLLTLAAARALGRPLRGPARDRTGLFTGVGRRPVDSGDAYRLSLQEHGGTRSSASAFSRGVMNASTGAAALAMGLRGPGATLANGRGAGLCALAWAWWRVSWDAELDGLLVGAVDERPGCPESWDPERPGVPAGETHHEEAAAAVLLAPSGQIRVLGVGLAGPNHAGEAVRRAAGERRVDRLLGSAAGPHAGAVEQRLAAELGCPWWAAGPSHAEATTALSRVAELVRAPEPGVSVVLSWCPRVGTVAAAFEVT